MVGLVREFIENQRNRTSKVDTDALSQKNNYHVVLLHFYTCIGDIIWRIFFYWKTLMICIVCPLSSSCLNNQ